MRCTFAGDAGEAMEVGSPSRGACPPGLSVVALPACFGGLLRRRGRRRLLQCLLRHGANGATGGTAGCDAWWDGTILADPGRSTLW